MPHEAVIVSAVRTPVGKAPRGTLRNTRPEELGALVIREVVARTRGLDPAEIEDVILGCAFPEGKQGMQIGRIATLAARYSYHYHIVRDGPGDLAIAAGRGG